MGFVEALIAVAVAGIASIVMMSIAINTTAQVLRNEIENKITEKAIEGSAMAKKIANNHNSAPVEEEILFPTIAGGIGNCYAFTGDVNNPNFSKQGESFEVACRYDAGDRRSCTNYLTTDEDIFRVFCMLPDSQLSSGLVVGKIVTGMADCDPNQEGNTGKCKISDYEYYLGVKVKQ